jgi:hypothetical protein
VNDSVLSLTAIHNTGYARTDTVSVSGGGLTRTVAVSQEAAQQIIAEPEPPVGNQGKIEIALEIPINEPFSVTFAVSLPAGFTLNQDATSLAPDLQSGYLLSITFSGGGWQFEIKPKPALLSAEETVYQQVVDIAYTMDETVVAGQHDVTIQRVDLTLNNTGETIHQDEIRVPIPVLYSVGTGTVEAAKVVYYEGLLSVNTAVSEQIKVYSISGQLLYGAPKAAGLATFDLNGLPRGVLIVRGSSGWVKKVVK